MKKRKMVNLWVFTYKPINEKYIEITGFKTKKLAQITREWFLKNVCDNAGEIVNVSVPAPEGK